MDNRNTRLVYILLATLILVFMLRFLVAFRFILFGLLVLLGIPLGIYLTVQFLRKRKREKIFKSSTEGRILSRLEECRVLLEENKNEIKEIQQNLGELNEEQQRHEQKMATKNWKDLQELKGGFKAELELRQSKTHFYQQCIRKLEQMLANHQLSKALEDKKNTLQSLQDEHFESLAKLEGLKTGVEMDVFYLDTIESLSQRMLLSSNIDDALQLKKELEEMTRELE